MQDQNLFVQSVVQPLRKSKVFIAVLKGHSGRQGVKPAVVEEGGDEVSLKNGDSAAHFNSLSRKGIYSVQRLYSKMK